MFKAFVMSRIIVEFEGYKLLKFLSVTGFLYRWWLCYLKLKKSQCLCRSGVHKCQFKVLKHVCASLPPGVLSVCLCVYKHTLSHTHNVVCLWWECLNCDYFPSAVAQGGDLVSVFPSMNYAWHSKQLWWIIPRVCVSVCVCVFLYLCVCCCVCAAIYVRFERLKALTVQYMTIFLTNIIKQPL